MLREFSDDGETVLMATHDRNIAALADQQLPFEDEKFSSNQCAG